MIYSDDALNAAHQRSSLHSLELKASDACGCFYCRKIFAPTDITEWVDDEDTALCPKCGIDSVIGSRSGYPVTSTDFLKAMHAHWFGGRADAKN